jgi:hypothetical protein
MRIEGTKGFTIHKARKLYAFKVSAYGQNKIYSLPKLNILDPKAVSEERTILVFVIREYQVAYGRDQRHINK